MNKKIWVIVGLFTVLVLITNRESITESLLSAEQELYIHNLHPVAQNPFRAFIRMIESQGWSVLITSGYRTWASQATLYAQNSKNASPGYSYHNYGLALDLNASNGSTWLNGNSSKQEWLNSGIPQLAIEHGFRWGGDFPGYYDAVHFDLPVMPTAQLHQLAIQQFGNNAENVHGNQLTLA